MPYASPADLLARYPESELRGITDATNQDVLADRLSVALADASAEIDGYLAIRYVLPLTDIVLLTPLSTPAVLVRACCDIAIYRLQTLRPRDDIKDARQRYEDCLKVLHLIGIGDVQLAGAKLKPGQAADPSDVPQSAGPTMMSSGRSDLFSRRNR